MRVLHTVRPSGPTTNPFVTLMLGGLPDTVDSEYFSWQKLLMGKYDVVHFQWPEKMVSADNALKRTFKLVAFRASILLLRARNTAIVATVHNDQPHEALTRGSRAALAALVAATDATIYLNPTGDADFSAPGVFVIPHGHYLSAVRGHVPAVDCSGEGLIYFGLIRDYKGVPELISTYLASSLATEGVPLKIIGQPWNSRLEDEVSALATRSAAITTRLEAVDESELYDAISHSRVVILPYNKLYNSGALMLALSLSKPVIAPRTLASEHMQQSVATGWVTLYDAPLTPEKLQITYRDTIASDRDALDLDSLDWSALGEQYQDAYRYAISRHPR